MAKTDDSSKNNGNNEDKSFDLDSLKLSQDFHKQLGVEKVLIRVPVRKPTKQEFIRVNPDPNYRLEAGVIELKEDREIYLLSPSVREQMPGEWIPVRLYTAINRQGVVFLWPVRLPNPDGRANPWHESAQEVADLAQTEWVKVVADMDLGAYQPFKAMADLPEPKWPEQTFQALIEVGFRGKLIQGMDHPVVSRLLGLE